MKLSHYPPGLDLACQPANHQPQRSWQKLFANASEILQTSRLLTGPWQEFLKLQFLVWAGQADVVNLLNFQTQDRIPRPECKIANHSKSDQPTNTNNPFYLMPTIVKCRMKETQNPNNSKASSLSPLAPLSCVRLVAAVCR